MGLVVLGLMVSTGALATTTSSATKRRSSGTAHASAGGKAHAKSTKTTAKTTTTAKKKTVSKTKVSGRHGAKPRLAVRRTRYREHFSASSFADNLTLGDVTDGEDAVVRAAAIEALGNMNGTAVAIDPATGRILAMVNQKLALSRGAEPCSTIKLTVALAALEEGIVKKDTPVNLGGRYHLTMTEALAHSNNAYFETLGRSLGFE